MEKLYYYNNYIISPDEQLVKEIMHENYEVPSSMLDDEIGKIFDFQELLDWANEYGELLEELYMNYGLEIRRLFDD